MKRIVLAVSVALVLSACGSAVKLDNTPVEDRTGKAVSGSTADDKAGSGGVAKSDVKTIDLTAAERDAFMKSTTRTVYFDYDSFVIRSEFQSVIEAHAKFIKADKSRKVTLEGHTDERGGREYNLALGQKRAEAVRKALVLQGVADSQLEAVSFGKEKPAALGNTEAAMEKNRRAEISYR
ncbi:peptidoglycan-associated lipoprotein Pal [Rhodoferax saidenbachensis]|uniref:Peptidoglycan-associated lipoprotein n=1 Tax=Rhodoferax saidenbachensis TaxID=1484693 RepID=A0ABU1ZIA0_9BURK|nr:peptidoglycan-associated lipoprotein Pal [Rhodoferax saidenbachensis]MDR7305265.1 peptidoglycan-associated lipoprotein [Rhodoferax saidenbachensis]